MRKFAKPEPGERELAIWSINKIRQNGGILEHPESSLLWKEMKLPKGNEIDEFGGYTISIDQFWFGHLARKRTWLYICGIPQNELPAIPIKFDLITHTVSRKMKRKNRHYFYKPEVSKADREHTPIEFAIWLINTAHKIKEKSKVLY